MAIPRANVPVLVAPTKEEVLSEMWRIASTDLSEAYNEDGSLKRLSEMPDGIRRAIAGISYARKPPYGIRRIKFWDKNAALRLVAQHLDMLGSGEDKGDVTIKLSERLEAALSRLAEARQP